MCQELNWLLSATVSSQEMSPRFFTSDPRVCVWNQVFQMTDFTYGLKLSYFSKKVTNEYYQAHFITVALSVAFFFDIQITYKRQPIRTNANIVWGILGWFRSITCKCDVPADRCVYTRVHAHTCTDGPGSKHSVCDRTGPIFLSRLSNVLCILKLLPESSNCITNAEWLIHSWWPLIYKKPGKCLGE